MATPLASETSAVALRYIDADNQYRKDDTEIIASDEDAKVWRVPLRNKDLRSFQYQQTIIYTGGGARGTRELPWTTTDNPVIAPVTIDGMDGRAVSRLSVPAGVDIPLAVEFDDSYNINWLTSCGTMHDFDLAKAHLRVEPTDPQSGTLALVVRDALGPPAIALNAVFN